MTAGLTGASLFDSLSSQVSREGLALANTAPLDFNATTTVEVGRPTGGKCPVGLRLVAGDYFRLLGVHFLQGNAFSPNSGGTVVNMRFVQECLKMGPAIGQNIHLGRRTVSVTGVINDVRTFGRLSAQEPEMYMEMDRLPENQVDVIFRATGDVAVPFSGIRKSVSRLNPYFSLTKPKALNTTVQEELAPTKALSVIMGLLTTVMLCISMAGAYWALSNSLELRRREYALRAALGACPDDLFWKSLVAAVKPVAAIALPVGALCGAGLGIWIASVLEGLPRIGAIEIFGAAAFVTAAVAVCSIGPALEASRILPSSITER